MSVVTDIFIMTSSLFDPEYDEDHQKIINQLNNLDGNAQEFKKLDKKAYGGAKVMQANVWCAAYNMLDLEQLIDFLRNVEWDDDVWVQICCQEENDQGFTLVQIKEVKS